MCFGVRLKVFERTMIVFGEEMKLIKNGYIVVEEEKIVEVGYGRFKGSAEERIDGKGLLAIPGFVNAHIHIGDSTAKELGFGRGLLELMKPPNGLKHRFLKKTSKKTLISGVRSTLRDMLASGITTFADFREGGMEGIKILKEALKNFKIHSITFGRPNFYMDEETLEKNLARLPSQALKETSKIFRVADGLGLSSPNEYTDKALKEFSSIFKGKKPIATHAAEHPTTQETSKRRTGYSEVYRALKHLKADILIHLTHATNEELEEVAIKKIGVVVCPIANSRLGSGFPPIKKMLDLGVTVALGSDNVMVNQPNMFKEMNYVLNFVSATEKNPLPISLKEIFRMATLNGAKILGLEDKIGSIEEGKLANIVFIDFTMDNLAFSHNILASLITRGRPENIKIVLVRGEKVVDKTGRLGGNFEREK